jgi:hypothetical protein
MSRSRAATQVALVALASWTVVATFVTAFAADGDAVPPEAENALSVLKGISPEKEGRPLVVKPDDARVTTFVAAITSAAHTGSAVVAEWCIAHFDDKVENVYADHYAHFALRRALAELPQGSKGEGVLKTRLKTARSTNHQIALVWATRKRPADAEIDATLLSFAKSKKGPLQLAAIKALGERRCISAVDDLIEIMIPHDQEKDRIWYDCRQALWAATGYDRETGKLWKSFWVSKGKRFDPEKDRGTETRYAPTLGVTVPGERVVVAIDTSGSLHIKDPVPGTSVPQPMPGAPPKLCPECGKDHGPGTVDPPPERQRIERGKVACRKILKALRPKAKFNLIRFDNKVFSWQTKGTLIEVGKHSLQSAEDYLLPVKPIGAATRMFPALDLAFAVEDLEVMYVVTDGAPTDDIPNSDDAVAIDEVIAKARVLNRYREVRIFGVGYKQCRSALLEVLAREHGGTVTYLD